jgi:tetratricopeptide (TPR) repeat protein
MAMMKIQKLIVWGCWIGALMLMLGSFAFADQNDPNLDNLFNSLQTSQSKLKAAEFERQIWARWNIHPNDQQTIKQMIVATNLMKAGKLNDAESIFSRIIASHPNFAEAWNKRATVRFFRGNNTGSVDDILHVIKLEPRHFGALSGLGMILVQAGDMQGALKVYSAAQKINPFLPQIDLIINRLGQKLKGRAL